ncbi:recombinase family protein [Shewanella indica]|uniref:recombinase family protein n=1 Tax=Shewanella indica TaxID=768528 RepID=UPI003D36B36A
MLTMVGAIATFERELMLERQAEGIALAKQQGKYKGRKPTATTKEKADDIMRLVNENCSKVEISRELNISLSSVNRVIKRMSCHIK